MLKQDIDPQDFDPQNSAAQEQSAGRMRVKKEEFAHAIAALEARRQSEAQAEEGTVIIGDVLQQLQIDVPAEEVLREIESLHSGQPREKVVRRFFWNTDQKSAAMLITGLFFIPIAAVGIAALILNPLRVPRPAVPTSTIFGLPPGNTPLWLPPLHLPPGTTGQIMDEGGFNASSVLMPLSQVPDNRPIHCTTASLTRLCTDYTRSQSNHLQYAPERPYGSLDPAALARSGQPFDVRPNLHKPWTLIKHSGKLYLRGWVAAKFTTDEAEKGIVTLHSTPQSFDAGVYPVPATLLMSFLQYSGDQMGYPFRMSESGPFPVIKARNVEVDEHAWEKW